VRKRLTPQHQLRRRIRDIYYSLGGQELTYRCETRQKARNTARVTAGEGKGHSANKREEGVFVELHWGNAGREKIVDIEGQKGSVE